MGDHGDDKNLGLGARGGGRRRGKPLLQGKLEEMGLNGCWDEDFTKALDHLSPRGLVGLADFHQENVKQKMKNMKNEEKSYYASGNKKWKMILDKFGDEM